MWTSSTTLSEKIAEEGDAVVIGRGSQYILHDRPDACHILVTAGQEARINLLVKKYNLTVDQRQTDHRRGRKPAQQSLRKIRPHRLRHPHTVPYGIQYQQSQHREGL